MSILNKPYEISVWDDIWNSSKGEFEEKRLGIIGAHTMVSLNRAMEPLFTRNVNGVKKLTFKMYKRYKDPETGEQIDNPFVDWLISERKVKLYYEDKWHDFIVKNITENSNNYLYTYQLEDALVQELSKNGFGIVLDTQLMNNMNNMNNMGTANELASKVLAETDWVVSDESETFVQTVEDHLVYATTTSEISAYRVIDQTDRKRGVNVYPTTIPGGKQVLVFYSSCVNKPYRFQFIYLDGNEIQKDSHRIITNKDCQYYIDVGASSNYTLKDSDAGLYLPSGFNISSQTEDGVAGVKISGAYRGKRYGFAQKTKYIPTLDRYVNLYEKIGSNLITDGAVGGATKSGDTYSCTMNGPTAGMYIDGSKLNLQTGKTYQLTYNFKISSGSVETIGGHSIGYVTKEFQVYGGNLLNTLGGESVPYDNSISYPNGGKFATNTNYSVKVRLTLKTPSDKRIWIQPNRGYTTNSSSPINFQVTNIVLKEIQEYYGYLNAEYKSPALTQNIISNTIFESASGWTGTHNGKTGAARAEVEPVLGYFSGGTFIDSIDEIANQTFDPKRKTYIPYLKITFANANSRVINSGPYDNRVSLGNIEDKDKWALSYECKSSTDTNITNLGVTLGEYTYDPDTLGYSLDSSKIVFSDFSKSEGDLYAISKVTKSTYSKEQFKKNSQVRVCIAPPSGASYPYVCYIKDMKLFKAIYNGTTLITPTEQGEGIEDRVIDKNYYYFTPEAIEDIENEEQLIVETKTKELDYTTYLPVFNADAQKIRSVTAKESNYFNILQSISETFEAWLVLDIERNDTNNPGKITAKKVAFKNYVGDNNYAGFRYGVNLKDIQRTYESKNIVTKLIVKQNSNEHAENGFCTIARANANPTGENYIYDFQYFHNKGLLDARDFLEIIYTSSGATGPDVENGTEYNLKGYYSRIKNLNKKIQDENDIIINIAKDITQYEADLEIAQAGYEAASSGIEEVSDSFKKLTNQEITNITDKDIKNKSDVRKLIQEYSTYKINLGNYADDKKEVESDLKAAKTRYETKKTTIKTYLNQKAALNQKFFQQYSRFIQEGTWMSEEYVDDEKYYADALSVMYNSCYPQVAYSINVLELSKLPGYELFTFGLGDKTFVEDPEFFGTDLREEVIITELSERLDDPSKNQIKVQNFKNQFQDLFQKITATVQQTQYSTGAYKKAVALAEAGQQRKQQFFEEALDSASARLVSAGQQSVTWGNDGITVKSVNSPSDAIRMVGGAILLSKQDKNGVPKWVTGVTSDGISANLITAGTINTGEISIMNYDKSVFKWDSFGLSAYDATWKDGYVDTVDTKRFVRFDEYGIYGINNAGEIDGENWKPNSTDEIMNNATFALTWEGLKVTGNSGVEARIGKSADNIIYITKTTTDDSDTTETKELFKVTNNGDAFFGGELSAATGTFSGELNVNASDSSGFSWKFSPTEGMMMWNGVQGSGDTGKTDGEYNDKNLVFKVEKDGLYMRGNGVFEGEIIATAGKIADWDITNSAIEFKKGTVPVVGMHSGDVSYASLVPGGGTSPIRFYAGSWGAVENFVRNKQITLTSDEVASPITDTSIVLTADEQTKYQIVGAKYTAATTDPTTFTGDYKQSILSSFKHNETTYIVISNACPDWVTDDEINNIEVKLIKGAGYLEWKLEYDPPVYLGKGEFSIGVTATLDGADSQDECLGVVGLTVEYKEIPTVNVSFDSQKATIDLSPKQPNTSYIIDVEYRLDLKNQNFKVLEDGSLYARNAHIAGHIEADSGSFKGRVEADDGSFKGHIEAESGNIGKLKIQNDGLEGYVVKNGNNINTFKLNSDGLEIFDSSAKIQVGSLYLKPNVNEEGYTVFAAQGAVSLQSGKEDDPTAYIRFGGVRSDTDETKSAEITLHAQAIGQGNKQVVSLYAKSTEPLPITKYITFYYSVATYGLEYSTNATSVTLSIPQGETQSNKHTISSSNSVVNQWLRFSRDASVMSTRVSAGSAINTEKAAELCMNVAGNTTFAEIKYDPFIWSGSSNNFLVNGNIVLDEGKTGNLGSSDSRWAAVFAHNFNSDESSTSLAYTDSGTVDSSDRNIKRNIEILPDSYSELFDSLVPVRYKYIENTSDRYHTGFIAQDVIDAVESVGLTSKDFAAYCAWKEDDGNETCGLRYSEFIALCVKEIQKLKKRVEELEERSETK